MRIKSLFHKKKSKEVVKRQTEDIADFRQNQLFTGNDGNDKERILQKIYYPAISRLIRGRWKLK